MTTLEWRQSALHQRAAQIDYIGLDNPLAAADADDEVERQVNMLREHPKMGRPGRLRGTRELVISSTPFIVIYKLDPKADAIEILVLVHSSQRWPPV